MIYDCDSFLVIFTGWVVIMIVSWAVEINLVYLREDRSDCEEFLSTLLSFTRITNNRVSDLHIVHLVRCNSELYFK